jgi:hypothetical protein
MLLSNETAYDNIPATTLGSYWNLVAHYGLAAHIYLPRSVGAPLKGVAVFFAARPQ